jgi:hypothetical protein
MTGQQYTYEEMKVEECWEEEEWKMEDREEVPVQIKKEQDPLQEITQVLEARSTMLCIKCHQGQSLFHLIIGNILIYVQYRGYGSVFNTFGSRFTIFKTVRF